MNDPLHSDSTPQASMPDSDLADPAEVANASPTADPFLLDSEQIQALAEPLVVRAGLRLCNELRVTALDRAPDGLYARVEDAETEEQLEVDITIVGKDSTRLLAGCQCDGCDDGAFCVHAIAALFAYAKGQGQSPSDPALLADAQRTALEERLAKARAEVHVEPLSDSTKAAGYGLWRARSLQSATHFSSDYRVHIRAFDRRANYCTCPDFATNELGTCKHVEAVLHRLRKRRDFKRIAQQPPPRSAVFLDWEGAQAPTIRLHRGAETATDLLPLLQEHFDADGRFRLRLPDDFLRFADQVAERGDLEIGDDALGYARRLAEDAARAVRAAEIGERIRDSGGRLPGVQAKLYPYQTDGVAFLAGRGRALLADDMGLGKTLQAIAAAYWLHRNDGVERVLVVCPASLKLQWAREIQRFTGADVQVVQGPVAARGVQYRKGRGFYVVNYELVMRDLSVINAELRPDLLILDEAQRIKNWRTKIASAVKQIGSRYAFVLTGTPLENRLEDLYSLLQVIDPRVLGPLWRYMVDFHITDDRGKVLGYRNLSELRRRLASVMLRRDRSLVRDQLPERILTRVDVPMSELQQEIHDDAINAAAILAQIMKRRPLTPSEQNRMMAALQRARMACNAAALVDPELAQQRPGKSAPKLDELETLLDEVCRLAGLKVVVFSQWALMTELVEQRVRAMKLGSVRLHGGVPTANRGALMDRFRDDDAIQVFISTDAGGVGLNLQNAAVLINLDIPWNPAVLEQRIARVHRLGQRQKVQAILLVAPESYEERVLGLVQGKRELFDNVVHEDATEDVVSVSKRLAEVLADDLTRSSASADADGAAGSTSATDDSAGADGATASATDETAEGRLPGTGLGDAPGSEGAGASTGEETEFGREADAAGMADAAGAADAAGMAGAAGAAHAAGTAVAAGSPGAETGAESEAAGAAAVATGAESDAEQERLTAESARRSSSSTARLRPDLDDAVRDCVIALQTQFGPRIQRMLAQRRRDSGLGVGMGGLLVVLDRVEEADDEIAAGLSERVPVALIDRRTLASLGRLGEASPVAEAEPLFDAEAADTDAGRALEAPVEPPLLRKAREAIDAARLLIQQRCPGPALDLMLSALLAAAAHRVGRADPPSPSQAGIWLYGEVLPAGLLEQSDIALLMRAIALGQGADAVPETLLTALADDAAAFIEGAAST
ncbi:MAG: DEAD/DEAH box helicase [Lamprobacter sp.]|uniref:DEAD/DEAH box helicase n=1 Tax=Lamprobacter sp. TaxID=3100796 RepID=UPI002B26120D|nr:DEAD/DEAH box helicase [Lamprobacter sp.]MEA3642467.1 DEAD/DEAH box helicase [Lamprobacter sp.]